MNRTWWKESVVYQIYPRSFKDTTGNGIGDIFGIIEKLDYIKSLGINVIWVCPIYESPNDDNGYDISDYRKISNEFGGQLAFDELLEKTHQKGMKLVMDLVANHTSDEHIWFQESKKSKDNPYRDYYFWKNGIGEKPPNNWLSFFSGSAWEKTPETDQYYLHLFTKKQPDLNWENPKVRQEIYDIIEFWFTKGVDGFRMDVISLISKQLDFPNTNYSKFQDTIVNHYANGPKIHEYLHEMNKRVLSKYDIMTVGEGPGIDLTNGLQYVDESRQELLMVFHFDHMFIDAGPSGKYDPVPIELVRFKEVFTQWDEALKNKGWGSIFLGNHDFSRMVSRFGNDGEYWEESAKLLAMLLLTLRGTVYIYQGDEIGMTNVAFPSIDYYNDVETLNAWKEAEAAGKNMKEFLKNIHLQSRDNARTPLQWNSEENAGFTKGTPWLGVNNNYSKINVESQEANDESILNFYRQMIGFRQAHKTLVYGDYKCLDTQNPNIYAYIRWDENSEFLILLNFSEKQLQWTDNKIHQNNYRPIISNLEPDGAENFKLKPWQAKLFVSKSSFASSHE